MNTIKEYRLLTIKEGNLKTSYEEHNQNSGRTSLITIENRDGVHADLEAALQRLAIHMKQMLNIPAVVDLTVSGYYKQPSGNAMLITFYAKLGNEGKANLAVRLLVGKDEYAYMEELLKAIGHCEQEAELCVQNGKSFGVERPVVVDDLDLLLLQKPNQVVAQC